MIVQERHEVTDIVWPEPVHLQLADGRIRLVKGPHSALECLVSDWPLHEGEIYERAKRDCMAALHHDCEVGCCRDTFIRASQEVLFDIH
jgi:hypothetical protein